MERFIYSWINTMLICGCICSLILFVSPEGKIKTILEIGASCVMLFALISPLKQIDLDAYASDLAQLYRQLEMQEQFYETAIAKTNKNIIEAKYCEYILSEAASHNLEIQSVEISTVQDENGNWVPCEIVYTASFDVPDDFKNYMETNIGVAKERQIIHESTGNLE